MESTNREKYLDAPNIHSMMNTHEAVLRSELLNTLTEASRPFFSDETEGGPEKSIIESLSEKGLITFKENGAIVGVYPVSVLPTRHKVLLEDGRLFYAMCAIDSLGISHEFDRDSVISSSCSKCGLPISIEIRSGGVSRITPATTSASHVSIEKYTDWASTC